MSPGRIRSLISSTFPLGQTREFMESGNHFEKIVLSVG